MEGGESDASSGGGGRSWCPVRVFPPRPSSSSSVDANASLANGLSQMALVASAAESPRPKKIRRRNAITVLDSSHLPLLHNTLGDSFESASLLQSLEDGVASAAAGAVSSPDAMPAPLQFHRNPTAVAPPGAKRKVPKARLKSNSSTSFKKHRQKETDIHSIRLHQDLTTHAPKNEILPESILKCYRDQYQNSLAEMAASAAETVAASAAAAAVTPASPCNALVLYTPPEKTIHKVLNTVRKNEAVKQQISNSVKKQRGGDATMEIDA